MSNVALKPKQPEWKQKTGGWAGPELTKDEITLSFTPEQLAAIDELMESITARGFGYEQITLADFSHPALNGLLKEVLRRLKQDGGLVVLAGFPVERYGLEDIEKIYWGIGTHFGRACSQSASGDQMGHVTDRRNSRGYNSARALPMHVDSAEIVGLLCVRTAKEGGENSLASALRLYEVIKTEKPEYLPVLEKGFRFHRRGEQHPDDAAISAYRVPVFSWAGGLLSCRYSRERVELAARDLEEPLTDFEIEALDFFEHLCFRDDVRFDVQLKLGEALLSSNFEMLHSRTAFVDREDMNQRRLVLRLWLEGEPPRPLKKEVFTYQNRSGRQGIDAQEHSRVGEDAFQPLSAARGKLVDG